MSPTNASTWFINSNIYAAINEAPSTSANSRHRSRSVDPSCKKCSGSVQYAWYCWEFCVCRLAAVAPLSLRIARSCGLSSAWTTSGGTVAAVSPPSSSATLCATRIGRPHPALPAGAPSSSTVGLCRGADVSTRAAAWRGRPVRLTVCALPALCSHLLQRATRAR